MNSSFNAIYKGKVQNILASAGIGITHLNTRKQRQYSGNEGRAIPIASQNDPLSEMKISTRRRRRLSYLHLATEFIQNVNFQPASVCLRLANTKNKIK